MNRRSVLIGMGGLAVGGGALVGTGAFDTVEAERTVSVETAGDADAFLALTDARGDEEYVVEEGGTIAINLDGNSEGAQGLNQDARTVLRNLVTVTNQGTQTVDSVELEFTETAGDVDASETFSFPVDSDEDDSEGEADNGENILTGSDGIPGELTPGDAVNFGLEIDLLIGGDPQGELPEGGEYTLTITAEAAE